MQHSLAVQGKELQPSRRGAAGHAKLFTTKPRPHTGAVLRGSTPLLSSLCWWALLGQGGLPSSPQQRVGSPS